MFVLLQVYPLEANADDGSDDNCCLDVIAVAPSKVELEQFLVGYEPRYRAAVQEFNAWDNMFKDWGPEHDWMLEELAAKHGVFGALVQARFEIMEVQVKGPLAPALAA
jgi:hypothetical protein